MEAHPVPQNVTTFQFRLIGDMTLKQFLYLSSGLGVAYLSFVFLAPNAPFLAWPIIVMASLLGVAFAFLPLGDRPLDHWLKAYLKAVYSPTKRVWSKNGKIYSGEPMFKSRLATFLSSQGISLPTPPPIPQITLPRAAQTQTPTPPSVLPSAQELSETVKLARQAHNLQQQIVQTEKELAQIRSSAAAGADKEASSEKLNTLLSNLQRLVKETTEVQNKLSASEPQTEVKRAQVKIEVVTPTTKPKVQLVLTSLPNVINGIVLDSQGNYSVDVVVVVRDKNGLPVRALKTNKLGQFTGATPLPNGIYTVELEKEAQVFDILKIELDGKVLPALNIAAKKVAGSS